MGKKNKKNQQSPKATSPEKSPQNGISKKSKIINKKPLELKQKANNAKNQKPAVQLTNGANKQKNVVENKKKFDKSNQKSPQRGQKMGKPAPQQQKKPQNNAGKAKNKPEQNKKGKQAKKEEEPIVSDVEASESGESGESDAEMQEETIAKEITSITKREKNRLKSEMKKELILKGKPAIKLADLKLLQSKLKKLEAKPEPRSHKVQKKIILIKALLTKQKDEKKNVPAKQAEEKKPVNVQQKPAPVEQSTNKNTARYPYKVFVGRLSADITKEKLKEHFESVGEIKKIQICSPKKRPSRKYGYIMFNTKEAQDAAFKLDGTTLCDRNISVLNAAKSRDKRLLDSENGKLQAQRKKEASLSNEQAVKVGKKLQKNKKKQKIGKAKK